MKKQSIDIIPLGGLSKIGSNICCFNVDDVTFAIDAGIRFPDTEHFDLNYSLPNLESIQKIDYLLITHCHEDHIGGVHKVIEEFPSAIIITTPFNDYLVKEKLHKNQTAAKVEVIEEGKTTTTYSTLYDIIRKFSSGKKINFNLTSENKIQIESEKSVFNLNCMSATEFPLTDENFNENEFIIKC